MVLSERLGLVQENETIGNSYQEVTKLTAAQTLLEEAPITPIRGPELLTWSK